MTTEDKVYLNSGQPVALRVKDLIRRMTLEEKVGQMMHEAPAIPRLGIPEYNWWNECLHGVARAGIATVFPQAIGLAATWDVDLIDRVATAISDEARAKHHEAMRRGERGYYQGLTFWSPNINIFRDPRWGRGQETYGEDPYLTAILGVAFTKGLQGEDKRYLKVVATPKHFAVHSGPEAARHVFDARISAHDLWDTYLPAFEACVRVGGVVSIMGAYNRTNGEPCCASPTLLGEILRGHWGFGGLDGSEGYVVSDCGAIRDIHLHHRVVRTAAEAAALAVREGCDLCCGDTYSALVEAVDQGLIGEAEIDRAIERLFTVRFRLGMFDPVEQVPYANISPGVNDSPEHRDLALEAARKSLVLLKNDGLLPLKSDRYSGKTIAVIGPNAADERVLWGNYNGTPSHTISILEGIRERVGQGIRVEYARGCGIVRGSQGSPEFQEAVELARQADMVIVVLGLSQLLEGEEGQREGVSGGRISHGDRDTLDLPGVQEVLLKSIEATGKPVVLVLVSGSVIAVNWASEHVEAILQAWYPGQAGGRAVAEALFGDYNPGGRLPVTFYRGAADLPAFEEYAMRGHTYRYFRGEALYPFGHGLSYTTFSYSHYRIETDKSGSTGEVHVQAEVQNTGDRPGDEVVQLYIRRQPQGDLEPADEPAWELRGFRRISLAAGEQQRVEFDLLREQFARVNELGERVVLPGTYWVALGGRLPRLEERPGIITGQDNLVIGTVGLA